MKTNLNICKKCRDFIIFPTQPYSKYCFIACNRADSEELNGVMARGELIKRGRVENTLNNVKNIERRQFDFPKECPYILEHTIK